MTFLILAGLIVIAVLTWEDIRENRRNGRDIVLNINGEALSDHQAEYIAQRIAAALERPVPPPPDLGNRETRGSRWERVKR